MNAEKRIYYQASMTYDEFKAELAKRLKKAGAQVTKITLRTTYNMAGEHLNVTVFVKEWFPYSDLRDIAKAMGFETGSMDYLQVDVRTVTD